jgi:hypothetical protein
VESGHDQYFRLIEFHQLAADEAELANSKLAAALGAKPQPVAEAYRLALVDVQGRTQIVNFIRGEANMRLGNYWGWSCSEPCASPQIFMAIKARQ